ncbi:MAG: PilZ domain-containing protein [Endomicrobiia bacterium]|nr:PilZ domain-containing protein [Endomicrobiia bacterium]
MDNVEKRKHARHILVSPVRISDGEKEKQGLIRNVSFSGIGFESYEIFAIGKKYRFAFTTGGFVKISALAEIKWSSEAFGKRLYGAEFAGNGFLTSIKIILLVRRLEGKRPL